MAKKKEESKQKDSDGLTGDIADQLEQAFLAGLGALSNAEKMGGNAFNKLVKQGKSFRKDTSEKTEALIDDVQDSIRGMVGDAQSRASGLLRHMQETPQLEKLQNVFDARVAGALDRLGVASRQSIDDLNAKLDRVLDTIEEEPPRKKAAKTQAAKKKTTRKPSKKVATKKTTTKKKAAKKKAAKKG